MNKLFTKIAGVTLGFAMVIGVGTAIGNAQKEFAMADASAGAGEALYHSASFTASNNHTTGSGDKDGQVSSYTASWYNTTTYNETTTVRWDVDNWNNNNNGWNGQIKCGAKNKTSQSDATLITHDTVGVKITKVELNFTSLSNKARYVIKLYRYVSSWIEVGSYTEDTGEQSVAIPSSDQAAGQKYKIAVSFDSTSFGSNGIVAIDHINLYQESSGKVNSVTVKSGQTTGTLNVTSGYYGLKRIALTADVDTTGVVSSAVTWGSADSSVVSVSDNGLITILGPTTNQGVLITATSVADSTVSGSITIVANNLQTYPGTQESTTFDTASYSSDSKPFDSDGKASSGLTNVRITTEDTGATTGTGCGQSGFYKNAPTSLRVYKDTELVISVASGYMIDYVVFESSTATGTNPLSNTNFDTNQGTLFFDGTHVYNDLTGLGSPVSSATYSASYGPTHIASITVNYRMTPEKEIEEFSTLFLTNLASACASENANNKSALLAEQISGKTLWEEQKDAFEALGSEVKALFGTSQNATVVRARTLYLHIIERYGLTSWADAPTPASSAHISYIISESNSIALVVIIISLVGITALGGYFFIRKRKHQ